MKIVYMGTPDFAVPPLRAMAQAASCGTCTEWI